MFTGCENDSDDEGDKNSEETVIVPYKDMRMCSLSYLTRCFEMLSAEIYEQRILEEERDSTINHLRSYLNIVDHLKWPAASLRQEIRDAIAEVENQRERETESLIRVMQCRRVC